MLKISIQKRRLTKLSIFSENVQDVQETVGQNLIGDFSCKNNGTNSLFFFLHMFYYNFFC